MTAHTHTVCQQTSYMAIHITKKKIREEDLMSDQQVGCHCTDNTKSDTHRCRNHSNHFIGNSLHAVLFIVKNCFFQHFSCAFVKFTNIGESSNDLQPLNTSLTEFLSANVVQSDCLNSVSVSYQIKYLHARTHRSD